MAGMDFSELQYLEHYYEKEESQIVVLYGQKNIGMQALLREFEKGKSCSYYSARPCSEREQLFEWGREIAEEAAPLQAYPSYGEIFLSMITKRCKKKVIIIREFQNIIKVSKNFMPELIRFIHNQWTNQPVMVVLCSSSIGWVENSLISKIGESAYEISGFIKMKESGILDVEKAFFLYDKKEQLKLYAVLGGFPELWVHFDKEASVKENICKNILPAQSYLQEAALRLVAGELRETSVYHAILASLAAGRQKLNDLHLHTGFSRAKISVYLKNLMELELVEKIFSFDTAGRENTQKGVYRIKNPFVHFYFCYLFPHMSRLERMSPEAFYERYIEPDFQEYAGLFFNRACSQYLQYLNRENRLPFVYEKSGEWVGKVGTIDMVCQDSAHTLIALCSWSRPMKYEDYEWLLFCAKKAKLKADYVYLFSAASFEEKLKKEAQEKKNIILMDLDRM